MPLNGAARWPSGNCHQSHASQGDNRCSCREGEKEQIHWMHVFHVALAQQSICQTGVALPANNYLFNSSIPLFPKKYGIIQSDWA